MASSSSSLTIRAIKELMNEVFIIPSYQRGYRWERTQVITLLDDIWEFQEKERHRDDIYCLQPIVIRKSEQGWEVIDGQQRLTTIFIILRYIHQVLNRQEKRFRIRYESRAGSEGYLNSIVIEQSQEFIDYYYIYNAHCAVKDWFEKKGEELLNAIKFYQVLLDNVKIIWYEIDHTETKYAIDVFTRLNIGKIPLTDAELIKALFLKGENFVSTEDVGEKRVRLRQLAIANQWDEIEYALEDESFWYFLTSEDPRPGPKISFILDLVADKKITHDAYHTFSYFSTELTKDQFELHILKRVDALWEKIYGSFMNLREWYTDRELYHLIGFILTAGATAKYRKAEHSINALQQRARSLSKKDFKKYLKTLIKAIVEVDLDTLHFDNRIKVKLVLLLFNIQSLLLNDRSNARFQFDRFKAEHWDIEHIHAVRSKLPENVAEQKEWISAIVDNEIALTKELTDRAKSFLELDTVDAILLFDKLADDILSRYDEQLEEGRLNTIGNLTLLDMKNNRSYKNSIFFIKRKKIIVADETGSFIPLCTKNVFLKYYSNTPDQLTLWTKSDMADYQARIASILQEFGVS